MDYKALYERLGAAVCEASMLLDVTKNDCDTVLLEAGVLDAELPVGYKERLWDFIQRLKLAQNPKPGVDYQSQ